MILFDGCCRYGSMKLKWPLAMCSSSGRVKFGNSPNKCGIPHDDNSTSRGFFSFTYELWTVPDIHFQSWLCNRAGHQCSRCAYHHLQAQILSLINGVLHRMNNNSRRIHTLVSCPSLLLAREWENHLRHDSSQHIKPVTHETGCSCVANRIHRSIGDTATQGMIRLQQMHAMCPY